MEQKKRCYTMEDEQNNLMKIINFRFPHVYKKIGLIGAITILLFLFGTKFIGYNDPILKDLCRSVMLLFLFLASLSRDVMEDEYVNHVRSQSYVLSFICAIAYSIILPLITFVLGFLIYKITGNEKGDFYEVSSFEVMFMLVCFQLLFFETLKRLGRAE